MATVNKDFKIKSGLVVEGSTATVGGFSVLTKKQDDQDYIVGLIGGTATSANTANTVVKRDASGNFAAGTITATVTGTVSSLSNHDTADLAEASTHKYFTDARAITATAASYDVIGAAAAAQSAAATDATTKANAAKTAAEATASADATTKANNAKSGAEATASADATTKANAARTAAESFATTADTAVRTAVTTEIGTAISTEVTNRNSAIASAISTEVTDRNTAITSAVSNLVDGAPALLDTLNELAFALGDQPDTITNLTTLVGTKAPLASPALTGVPTAPTAAADTSTTQIATTAFAKAEADAAQTAAEATASADATTKANAAQSAATSAAATDATTKANAAQSAAASDATTKANAAQAAAATDATTKANAAQAAAIAVANALTTSDVEEGTAQYFTDARAKASAAALLTGATKTNITISGTGAGLTITAENGVADSTTTDLAEGTNLYFTDARARAAVDGTTRSFTAVELNSVAKQVAATLSAPTAGVQTAHAFAKADYRSAEYLVKVANGSHTDVSKVLLTLDSSDNIAITEYGMVSTGSSLGSVSASISGANVQLLVTTANNTSTVTVVGTLLA
jgi:hypothetical protein